ncbi:hypothetical protein C2845_PM12G14200 [Panicum miliaceum]|uniref:Serine/threonine-protein kinase BSK1-like TPR repeats domain-containing protein n=1 Tax=Panicum miliaceum TaxID=4540 RepID=A0A3L6QES5_PANMI|nr:hypothetical protein C2845_PM12G14200 [Panicum miliaceum]
MEFVSPGYCKIVEILLSKGASVDALPNRGTPLHLAATDGHHKTVKILLDHNADCNKIVHGIYTPLLVSIYAPSLKCVKILLKAGADVNGVGNITPLIDAVSGGLTECMKCLLKAGADPNVPDEFGRMPIEFAAICGSREDVSILFPLTSRIPSVYDWSVDGIMLHACLLPGQKFYEIGLEKETATLKLQGEKALEKKDYHSAIKLYTKAMGLDNDDATLYSNRSLCFLQIGDGDKAFADAYTCRMNRPDWPKAWYVLGAALMLLKRKRRPVAGALGPRGGGRPAWELEAWWRQPTGVGARGNRLASGARHAGRRRTAGTGAKGERRRERWVDAADAGARGRVEAAGPCVSPRLGGQPAPVEVVRRFQVRCEEEKVDEEIE